MFNNSNVYQKYEYDSVTINQDVKDGGLANRAKGLKDNSSRLKTEANETQTDLQSV